MTAQTIIPATANPRATQSVTHRRFITRYPVTAFLVMVFTFAWTTIGPLLLSQQGFGVLPITLPVQPFITLASYIGLALPAFLVMAALHGRIGVQDLLRRSLRWRVGLPWYLVALFGLFFTVIVAALPFVGLAPLAQVAQKWPLLFTVFLPGVLVPFLLINLPEEIAWTGFLQATWQRRYGPVWASVMVAPIFALIHLPAYFVAGWLNDERISFDQYPTLLIQIGLTIVFSLFFRLLIMWLYNSTRGSLLIVGLFHSAFNMSSGQQITPVFIPGPTVLWLNLFVVAVTAALAVLITAFTKGRLAYKPASAE